MDMLKAGLTVHYEPFAQGHDTKVFIGEFNVDNFTCCRKIVALSCPPLTTCVYMAKYKLFLLLDVDSSP